MLHWTASHFLLGTKGWVLASRWAGLLENFTWILLELLAYMAFRVNSPLGQSYCLDYSNIQAKNESWLIQYNTIFSGWLESKHGDNPKSPLIFHMWISSCDKIKDLFEKKNGWCFLPIFSNGSLFFKLHFLLKLNHTYTNIVMCWPCNSMCFYFFSHCIPKDKSVKYVPI